MTCIEFKGKTYNDTDFLNKIRQNPILFFNKNNISVKEINNFIDLKGSKINFKIKSSDEEITNALQKSKAKELINAIQNKLNILADAKKQIFRTIKYYTNPYGNLNKILAEDSKQNERDQSALIGVLEKEKKYFDELKNLILKQSKELAKKKGLDEKKIYKARIKLIRDYLAGDISDSFTETFGEQIKKELDYFRNRINETQTKLIQKFANSILNYENKIKILLKEIENTPENTSKENKLKAQIKNLNERIQKTKDFISKIENSKGTYLNRSYQIFTDKDYADEISKRETERSKERFERASKSVAELLKINDENNNRTLLSDEEYLEEARKSLEIYISDIVSRSDSSNVELSYMTSPQVKGIFKKLNENLDPAIRELLGEHEDPALNYLNTIFKISSYIATYDFEQNLTNSLFELGLATYEAQPNHILAFKSADNHSPIFGVYIPREVAQEIEERDLKSIKDIWMRNWIKASSLTKIGLTVGSPTTQARNFLSGNFLGLAAGHFWLLNPRKIPNLIKFAIDRISKDNIEEFEKLIKLGVLNDGLNSGQFNEDLKNLGSQLDFINKKRTIGSKVWDVLQTMYSFGDDFYKVVGYYQEREGFIKSGMNESDAEKKAGERIRNSYPTYSYLPKGLKELRRFPLIGSFVSFPYEILRTTKNNLLYTYEDFKNGRKAMGTRRAIGMLIASISAPILSEYTKSLMGWDDEDEDGFRSLLSEYQTDSNLIYLGYDKNGKPTYIDTTPFFPMEIITKPLRIIFEDRAGRNTKEKLILAFKEVLSPYISQDIFTNNLSNIFRNQDNFDNKIWYKTDDPVEISTKILDYFFGNSLGIYKNAKEFLRANEITGDKYTSYGREFTNRDAILGLAGFRVSKWSIPTLIGNKVYDVMEFKAEESKKVKEKLKNEDLTAQEIEKFAEKTFKNYQEEFKPLKQAIIAGQKLNISKNDIFIAIDKKNRLSESILNALYEDRDIPVTNISERSVTEYENELKTQIDNSKEINKKINRYRNNAIIFFNKINELNEN